MEGTPERDAVLQKVVDARQRGRWKLTAELGRGSAGVVFGSADNRFGQVAIKFSHAEDPKTLKREVTLLQRVAHPHICRYYEHHELHSGLWAVVLELLDGGSLAQLAEQSAQHRLPEADVTQMSLQILDALQFMHGQNVIHRDVKPSTSCSAQILKVWCCTS